MMGAAGAVEAAVAVLACDRQIVPPTINYRTPDPDCDLDYVPNEARPMEVRHAMSTSVGLGGIIRSCSSDAGRVCNGRPRSERDE